jgi:hypothetical protein
MFVPPRQAPEKASRCGGAHRLGHLEEAEVPDVMPAAECDEVDQDQSIMQFPSQDFALRAQG